MQKMTLRTHLDHTPRGYDPPILTLNFQCNCKYGAVSAIVSPIHMYLWCALCMYLYKNNMFELYPTIYLWIIKTHDHVPSLKGTQRTVNVVSMDRLTDLPCNVLMNHRCRMVNSIPMSSLLMLSKNMYCRLTLGFIRSKSVLTVALSRGQYPLAGCLES